MNQSAERHLAKAEEYVGKGEEFYRKAAAEIAAAKEADSTLSNKAVGERLGYSGEWVASLLRWREDGHTGSRFTAQVDQTAGGRNIRGAQKVLREAPMEQIEQIISELPASRQRQIGAAAGDSYLGRLNEVADNTRRNVTDAVNGLFWPNIDSEKRALLRKLDEIKTWLDQHGDDMVPEPMGEADPEPARDIMLDGLRSEKAKIDTAFAALGVGTSIEEGFRGLLSES
jgi:hypothetical protein